MGAPLLTPGPQRSALPPACAVRPLQVGEGPEIDEFGSRPGVRYFCFGSDAYRRSESAPRAEKVIVVAAVTAEGTVVALGNVLLKDAAAHVGEVTLAVQAAHEHAGVIDEMLSALAAGARARGIRRLVTAVPRERNPFPCLRDAGMHTVSWFNAGGVTEVVLGLD